jgi:GTP-binding protein
MIMPRRSGLPIVAIVGRPNVGKSTLFNRVLRRRQAVVHDEAGITRDRNYARAEWNGRAFWLVDTGGVIPWRGRGIEIAIQEQVKAAIGEADAVLMLLDVRVGLLPEDEEVLRRLLREGKPVIVAANKADNDALALEAAALPTPGAGTPLPLSALSGRGVPELLERIVALLPKASEASAGDEEDESLVRVAIVGRPNVGKSSLVNALLGKHQMIVDAQAGTTRDSVDTPLRYGDTDFLLIDTAGLRRRRRAREGVEYWSAVRSLRAIERCDVAVVVLDATRDVGEQDVRIAGEAVESSKAVILVVNKWDAIEKDPHVAERYEDRLRWHIRFLPDAPIVYASALTGRRVRNVLREARALGRARCRRIPTAQVNEVLRKLVATQPPPSRRSGRATRIFYGTQVAARPPTFVIFTNRPENIAGHYERFLRNRLAEELGFRGVPVRVLVRRRDEGEKS